MAANVVDRQHIITSAALSNESNSANTIVIAIAMCFDNVRCDIWLTLTKLFQDPASYSAGKRPT